MNLKTLALAAVLGISLPAFASGDASVGKKKAEPCKACHGEFGISATGDFPNLAGQYSDYIVYALNHYKNGKRKNPIMQGQVANLSPKDIADLAAFYSSQRALSVKY